MRLRLKILLTTYESRAPLIQSLAKSSLPPTPTPLHHHLPGHVLATTDLVRLSSNHPALNPVRLQSILVHFTIPQSISTFPDQLTISPIFMKAGSRVRFPWCTESLSLSGFPGRRSLSVAMAAQLGVSEPAEADVDPQRESVMLALVAAERTG